jgi:ABC-type transport system substrate-binding protein
MDRYETYWTRFPLRRRSRRSVLAGSLGVAGLAVAGGLTACTTATTTPTVGPAGPVASPTRSAGGATGATTGGKQIQFARFLQNPPDFSAKPKYGGVLTVATQYNPQNLNPQTVSSIFVGTTISVVYERLLRGKWGWELNPYFPWKFEPVGELAESWTASPDGTEYTIKIRQGVKFQNVPPVNGREFTAEDAKWSIENSKTDWWAVPHVKAAGATVTAPDKYTLKIGLKEKVSWMIPMLADSRGYMVPKEIADMPGGFNENAIGTGAFILKERIPNTRITFAKNPEYWDKGKPYLDGLEYQIIPDLAAQRAQARTGQAQMVGGDAPQRAELEGFLRSSPDFTVLETDTQSGQAIWHISMRMDKAPFNDVRVRRAISLAINRKGIIDAVHGGKAQVLLPFVWTSGYDSPPDERLLGPWYRYDPEQAKRLLAEAGVREGTRWEFLIGRYSAYVEPTAQLIQQDFKRVGIELELKIPDLANFALQYRPPGQKPAYEHLAYGVVFTNPVDPTLSLMTNLRSDASINTDQINDPKLDEMLTKLAAEPDTEKQKPMFRQIWEYMSDQAYWPALPDGQPVEYWHKSVYGYLTNYRNLSNTWGAGQFNQIWLNK